MNIKLAQYSNNINFRVVIYLKKNILFNNFIIKKKLIFLIYIFF